jgi:hypothetical protein
MRQTIEIVSISGGKFHRPQDTTFSGGGSDIRDARLMRCGRSLVPLNFFETIADANRHTGGRLEGYICQQCERKVSHLWRVPEVLKNGNPKATATVEQDSGFKFVVSRYPDGSLQGRPYVTANGGGHVCEGFKSEYSIKQIERMVEAANAHDALIGIVREIGEGLIVNPHQPDTTETGIYVTVGWLRKVAALTREESEAAA